MTSISLARSYFLKARKRLRALETLFDEEAFSDVVREAQELVELALKGMLRFIGIEPPKHHDVGPLLLQYRDRLPPPVGAGVERLAEISPGYARSGSSGSTETRTSSRPTSTRASRLPEPWRTRVG